MRVLVLGGDGMLGQMLRHRLATYPGFVVEWTSRRRESAGKFFRVEEAEKLEAVLENGRYDYVVNCIGLLKNALAERGDEQARVRMTAVNEVFPRVIAAMVGKFGTRLVHISTDAVFAAEAGPCTEEDIPQPSDFYGGTKFRGEPRSAAALTLRCSIMGPDPMNHRGLFEWFYNQPVNASIPGFDDQLWGGVTTLQVADLAAVLFSRNLFANLRANSAVQHFAPNEPVTKYQLLSLLGRAFRPDLKIECRAGGKVTRVLQTCGSLREVCGDNRPMDVAIGELSTYIGAGKSPSANLESASDLIL